MVFRNSKYNVTMIFQIRISKCDAKFEIRFSKYNVTMIFQIRISKCNGKFEIRFWNNMVFRNSEYASFSILGVGGQEAFVCLSTWECMLVRKFYFWRGKSGDIVGV